VQKQPKTAFLYYTLAAGMQNEAAQLKLGECYKTGFGTEQDMREAIRWYELAAKTNKIALICLG
jgi:TPR repeat protein